VTISGALQQECFVLVRVTGEILALCRLHRQRRDRAAAGPGTETSQTRRLGFGPDSAELMAQTGPESLSSEGGSGVMVTLGVRRAGGGSAAVRRWD
jgi:hypothetical protein